MILAFQLSMPGCPSWNGKWSGDDEPHYIVKTFRGSWGNARAEEVLRNQPYSYSWEDGWRAGVNVRQVDSREAARLRRITKGFSGYDWMVDTIIEYGKPLATHEIPKGKESA